LRDKYRLELADGEGGMTQCRTWRSPVAVLAMSLLLPLAVARAGDDPPLSPAQIALFETPHLKDIAHPETLTYRLERAGPDPLVDSVSVHIQKIHPDGTKYVSFDFMTGQHRLFFPAVDDFSGNPLLMLFLEHDVQEMKEQTGIAAAYFRDHIRAAFADRANMSSESIAFAGKTVAARLVTLRPFLDDPRLANLPSFRDKTYRFVLSEDVPGQIDVLAAEMPPDPSSGAPGWSETITFVGEKPE
jgi:hypothetical protein